MKDPGDGAPNDAPRGPAAQPPAPKGAKGEKKRQTAAERKRRSVDAGSSVEVDIPSGTRGAHRKAEKIAGDKDRVNRLLAEAAAKAMAGRARLGDAWQQLQTLFRLVKAWVTGQYRDVPWRVIVLSITALVYFVNPFDLIPDFLGFGFLDDIGVIGFLFSKMTDDLDKFRAWEAAHANPPASLATG